MSRHDHADNPVPATAVILAAGLGARFGAPGRLRPKGFIELDGQPIIERSIDCMLDAGIARVLIVTGHLHDFYQALAARRGDRVSLVHNPLYAESGSMFSLFQLRGRLAEDFWLFESDLVYERRALDELARVGRSGASVLLMSGATGSGDEVYVQAGPAPGYGLQQLSKQRDRLVGEPAGELVGITRISAACFDAMNAAAEAAFATSPRVEYEQALVEAARSVPVACHRVADLAWSEIDTAEHLARVQREVLPRIRVADAAPRPGS